MKTSVELTKVTDSPNTRTTCMASNMVVKATEKTSISSTTSELQKSKTFSKCDQRSTWTLSRFAHLATIASALGHALTSRALVKLVNRSFAFIFAIHPPEQPARMPKLHLHRVTETVIELQYSKQSRISQSAKHMTAREKQNGGCPPGRSAPASTHNPEVKMHLRLKKRISPPQVPPYVTRRALEGLISSKFSGSSNRGPLAAIFVGRQLMSVAEEKTLQKLGSKDATDAPMKRGISESTKRGEAMERARKLAKKYTDSLKTLAD